MRRARVGAFVAAAVVAAALGGGCGRGGAQPGPSPSAAALAFLAGWAAPEGGETDAATGYPRRVRRTADEMTMVLIPAGTFQMGAVPADDQAEADEKPRHAVTLSKAYYLDEHEVTNEQFGRFVAATRHVTRAEAVGNGFVTDDSGACDLVEGASWAAPLPKGRRPMDWALHPVVLVAWEDATAYARWAGASLPTEAQFERALRGGAEGRKYPWGDGLPAPRGSGNYADATAERRFSGWTWTMEGYDDGHERTAPVKSFAANGYGAYDLSGNVWEWCSDWYAVDIYGQSPARDPAGPASGSSRVARGGSWFNVGPGNLRASHRDDYGPSIRSDVLGFRCSRSLP